VVGVKHIYKEVVCSADNYVLYKEYKEKDIVLITKGTKFNSYIYHENKNIVSILDNFNMMTYDLPKDQFMLCYKRSG
jgi:hypothetical protein